MALLLCESNMNFTASTWKTIDATSALTTATTWNWLTTTYVSSSNFTPGAITVEGIMVKLDYVRNTVGTMSVRLFNATAGTAVVGTEVNINISDIPQQNILQQNSGGWIYLKFASPVTLLAATAYNIQAKSTGQILLNVTSGNNWLRGLVTSTTAAPAATDRLFVCGFYTNLSAGTSITCTYDNTTSSVYGSISVGAFGRMILQNNPSTNYVMKIATTGLYENALNAVTEFGNSSSPLVSSSTLLLELQATAAATNGIDNRNMATFTAYGTPKTRRAKLAANSAVGATTLTTDISTGWVTGDELSFAQTVRSTSPQVERKALTANAVGTTLTISAMTLAKLGTGDFPCDIGLMTSNIKIYGTSATSTFYFRNNVSTQPGTGKVDFSNVEFRYFGSSTGGRFGFELNGSVGCLNRFNNCSFADGNSGTYGLMIFNGVNENFEIENNVFYNVPRGVSFLQQTITTGTKKINNNLFINSNFSIGSSGGITGDYYECKNNTVSAATSGQTFNIINSNTAIDGLHTYCALNTSGTFTLVRSTIKNVTSYNAGSIGITIGGKDSIIENCNIYGAISYNILCNTLSNITLKSFNIQAGLAGSTCPSGVVLQTAYANLYIDNSVIGTVSTHSTGDIVSNVAIYGNVVLRNTTLGSSTQISGQSLLGNFDRVSQQRISGVAGTHRSYKQFGRLDTDSIIFDSSPRSSRMTPNSAVNKLCGTPFQIAVANGTTATFSIKVRKSVAGDGTAYNGNQPRLILRSNPSAGSTYNSTIVCATASGSAGVWETLSYTLPIAVTDDTGMEFYVDCDGTLGWINVDSITTS
jgi:hypothetical protein